jgi:hypothetical protein
MIERALHIRLLGLQKAGRANTQTLCLVRLDDPSSRTAADVGKQGAATSVWHHAPASCAVLSEHAKPCTAAINCRRQPSIERGAWLSGALRRLRRLYHFLEFARHSPSRDPGTATTRRPVRHNHFAAVATGPAYRATEPPVEGHTARVRFETQ